MTAREQAIHLYAERYFGEYNANVLQSVVFTKYVSKRELFHNFKHLPKGKINLILAILYMNDLILCLNEKFFFDPSDELLFRNLSQRGPTFLMLLKRSSFTLQVQQAVATVLCRNGRMSPTEILEKSYRILKDPSKKQEICQHINFLAKTGFIGCQGKSIYEADPYRADFIKRRFNNSSFFGELYDRNIHTITESISLLTKRSHEDIMTVSRNSGDRFESLWSLNRPLCHTFICLEAAHAYIASIISRPAANAFRLLSLASLVGSKSFLLDIHAKNVPASEILQASFLFNVEGFPDTHSLSLELNKLCEKPHCFACADSVRNLFRPDMSKLLTAMAGEICSRVVGRRVSKEASLIFDLLALNANQFFTQELIESTLMLNQNSATRDLLFMYREGFITHVKDPSECLLDTGESLVFVNLEKSSRSCAQILQHMLKSLMVERKRVAQSVRPSLDEFEMVVSLQSHVVQEYEEGESLSYIPPEEMDRMEWANGVLRLMSRVECGLVSDVAILQEFIEVCVLRRYYSTDNIDEYLAKNFC